MTEHATETHEEVDSPEAQMLLDEAYAVLKEGEASKEKNPETGIPLSANVNPDYSLADHDRLAKQQQYHPGTHSMIKGVYTSGEKIDTELAAIIYGHEFAHHVEEEQDESGSELRDLVRANEVGAAKNANPKILKTYDGTTSTDEDVAAGKYSVSKPKSDNSPIPHAYKNDKRIGDLRTTRWAMYDPAVYETHNGKIVPGKYEKHAYTKNGDSVDSLRAISEFAHEPDPKGNIVSRLYHRVVDLYNEKTGRTNRAVARQNATTRKAYDAQKKSGIITPEMLTLDGGSSSHNARVQRIATILGVPTIVSGTNSNDEEDNVKTVKSAGRDALNLEGRLPNGASDREIIRALEKAFPWYLDPVYRTGSELRADTGTPRFNAKSIAFLN